MRRSLSRRASLAATLLACCLAAPARAEVFSPSGPPLAVALRQVATAPGPLTALAHAGDSRLFLVLREGRVLVLDNGRVLRRPFLDVRSLVGLEGEGGLLSIAFHPRSAENGFVFVAYTNRSRAVVVARYQVSPRNPSLASPGSAKVLLTIPKTSPLHNGGQLRFGPDGYLYVSVGDGARGRNDTCDAQNGATLLGKILRLDVDSRTDRPPYYSIPRDNPFREGGAVRAEVWASGLRNPWRFSFDRLTGDLWIGDVGNSQREEIDFQPADSPGGENYGWKVMEGTNCFRATACPASTPPCGSAQYTPPVLEYDHGTAGGCAVTGGVVYHGPSIPQLRGTYVFGDFCTGKLWSARRGEEALEVRELSGRAPLLTSFGEDRSGELYLTTADGKLYRLQRAQ